MKIVYCLLLSLGFTLGIASKAEAANVVQCTTCVGVDGHYYHICSSGSGPGPTCPPSVREKDLQPQASIEDVKEQLLSDHTAIFAEHLYCCWSCTGTFCVYGCFNSPAYCGLSKPKPKERL